MSTRNVGEGEPSSAFLAQVYEDDGSDSEESEQETEQLEMDELEEDEYPEPPPFSALSSPVSLRRADFPIPRDRSRSPICIGPSDSDVEEDAAADTVIQFDESGTEMTVYLTPDAHVLFEIGEGGEEERADDGLGDARGGVRGVRRSVHAGRRGRLAGRGGRSGRGRGRRRGHPGWGRRGSGRRQAQQWVVGDPLVTIYMTDDDVPAALREQVREVVRSRQQRAQEVSRRAAARYDNLEVGYNGESEDEDEFHDASDGRESLLEGDWRHFDWRPTENFQVEEEVFLPERTGPSQTFAKAYSAFRSYWTDEMLAHIVTETNLCAAKISSRSFQAEWYNTNVDEILCLFAFWMMLGIIRMPTIASCFSTHALLQTDIFRKIFVRRRYENLTRALNFVDADPARLNDANPTTTDGDSASLDRLYLLRPVIDHLNAKFQANYIPSKDICIDESLTLWKGRLNIKQYIRTKAAKFGIKSYELCESATGYLWSFVFYTGKQPSADLFRSGVNKSTALVLKLIGPLLGKGYRLFMDNWFNSPLLARFLKRNATDCVGTLRSCRADVPQLVRLAPLKPGQLVARHAGDVCVLSWHDKEQVTMLSTCHGPHTAWATVPSFSPKRPLPFKPQMVLDYNRSMGGVDLKDQILEPYLIERKKCTKWYMKLFKRLLNCSILNSRILVESTLNRRQDHLLFRLDLVDEILKIHLQRCPVSRSRDKAVSNAPPSRMPPHSHWLISIPQSNADASRNRKTFRNCVACARVPGGYRRKSPFQCAECKVSLCVEPCFKTFHTS